MPVVQFLLRNLLLRAFQVHYLLGNWDNDLLLPYCLLIKWFPNLNVCLLNWEKCLGIVKLFAFGNLCRIFHFDGVATFVPVTVLHVNLMDSNHWVYHYYIDIWKEQPVNLISKPRVAIMSIWRTEIKYRLKKKTPQSFTDSS